MEVHHEDPSWDSAAEYTPSPQTRRRYRRRGLTLQGSACPQMSTALARCRRPWSSGSHSGSGRCCERVMSHVTGLLFQCRSFNVGSWLHPRREFCRPAARTLAAVPRFRPAPPTFKRLGCPAPGPLFVFDRRVASGPSAANAERVRRSHGFLLVLHW